MPAEAISLTPDEQELVEFADDMASLLGERAPDGFGQVTDQQRRFACAYVLLGGNASKAALAAGYRHPHVMGNRLSINPRVSELIKTLALAGGSSHLVTAMKVLADLANDPNVKPETRRNCALDLAKMVGAMPKAGPTTAVQINAAGGSGEGGAAGPVEVSVVLQQVEQRRTARLSDTVRPMSDSPAMIDASPREPASDDAREGQGGGG